MAALLENWCEDTDMGVLEQILGSLPARAESKAAQKALRKIRDMRQVKKSDEAARRQQTLLQTWANAARDHEQ